MKKKHPFYQSKAWNSLKKIATRRYKHRGCSYCNRPFSRDDWIFVDHIKPRKTHPELALELSNLQLMHHACHNKKSAFVDNNPRPRINLDGYPEGTEWDKP